jgi:hypothetical protein
MRIIDNKKDYYDYLAGVLGIDGYITYDRRNSTRLVNKTADILNERCPMGYGQIFCPWKNGKDPNSDSVYNTEYDWDNGHKNLGWGYRKYGPGYQPSKSNEFPDAYNVSSNFFGLVIGSVAYAFLVYRVLQNETDKEVKIVPKLMRKFVFDRSKTKSKAPILIGELTYNHLDIPWRIACKRDDEFYDAVAKVGYISPDKNGDYKENPIMDGTWIPSLIPAEEVWNNITDYLLSIKEPEIIDNRTDVQHLESHGFDKKTSFRNVK